MQKWLSRTMLAATVIVGVALAAPTALARGHHGYHDGYGYQRHAPTHYYGGVHHRYRSYRGGNHWRRASPIVAYGYRVPPRRGYGYRDYGYRDYGYRHYRHYRHRRHHHHWNAGEVIGAAIVGGIIANLIDEAVTPRRRVVERRVGAYPVVTDRAPTTRYLGSERGYYDQD